MRRLLSLAPLTVFVAVAVYLATLFLETLPSRRSTREPDAGLQWLRHELDLTDRQMDAISRLQEAYRPSCQTMCRQILASDSKLRELFEQNRSITPEMLTAMAERDQLRSKCRRAFLRHVHEVSGELSAPQRQRYLSLVSDEILGPSQNASVGQRGQRRDGGP
ncbi:Spy/CpxP family protein refolding chaperone [Methylacidimicrobium sp. B4]|uniref:periplasmic heavy metal sensor n=1 Tax=Methylacidimicrobium sp. B4 TaxID=2796139 RepID=UPI001A8D50E6|nr:Spy/CpxP family protein refolding chaperone [Methylacidimicrobium sp. B4]QSR83875.1 Spy/CpxP family protein refolding chaperone [Methylacidimicrobium sp. B4]